MDARPSIQEQPSPSPLIRGPEMMDSDETMLSPSVVAIEKHGDVHSIALAFEAKNAIAAGEEPAVAVAEHRGKASEIAKAFEIQLRHDAADGPYLQNGHVLVHSRKRKTDETVSQPQLKHTPSWFVPSAAQRDAVRPATAQEMQPPQNPSQADESADEPSKQTNQAAAASSTASQPTSMMSPVRHRPSFQPPAPLPPVPEEQRLPRHHRPPTAGESPEVGAEAMLGAGSSGGQGQPQQQKHGQILTRQHTLPSSPKPSVTFAQPSAAAAASSAPASGAQPQLQKESGRLFVAPSMYKQNFSEVRRRGDVRNITPLSVSGSNSNKALDRAHYGAGRMRPLYGSFALKEGQLMTVGSRDSGFPDSGNGTTHTYDDAEGTEIDEEDDGEEDDDVSVGDEEDDDDASLTSAQQQLLQRTMSGLGMRSPQQQQPQLSSHSHHNHHHHGSKTPLASPAIAAAAERFKLNSAGAASAQIAASASSRHKSSSSNTPAAAAAAAATSAAAVSPEASSPYSNASPFQESPDKGAAAAIASGGEMGSPDSQLQPRGRLELSSPDGPQLMLETDGMNGRMADRRVSSGGGKRPGRSPPRIPPGPLPSVLTSPPAASDGAASKVQQQQQPQGGYGVSRAVSFYRPDIISPSVANGSRAGADRTLPVTSVASSSQPLSSSAAAVEGNSTVALNGMAAAALDAWRQGRSPSQHSFSAPAAAPSSSSDVMVSPQPAGTTAPQAPARFDDVTPGGSALSPTVQLWGDSSGSSSERAHYGSLGPSAGGRRSFGGSNRGSYYHLYSRPTGSSSGASTVTPPLNGGNNETYEDSHGPLGSDAVTLSSPSQPPYPSGGSSGGGGGGDHGERAHYLMKGNGPSRGFMQALGGSAPSSPEQQQQQAQAHLHQGPSPPRTFRDIARDVQAEEASFPSLLLRADSAGSVQMLLAVAQAQAQEGDSDADSEEDDDDDMAVGAAPVTEEQTALFIRTLAPTSSVDAMLHAQQTLASIEGLAGFRATLLARRQIRQQRKLQRQGSRGTLSPGSHFDDDDSDDDDDDDDVDDATLNRRAALLAMTSPSSMRPFSASLISGSASGSSVGLSSPYATVRGPAPVPDLAIDKYAAALMKARENPSSRASASSGSGGGLGKASRGSAGSGKRVTIADPPESPPPQAARRYQQRNEPESAPAAAPERASGGSSSSSSSSLLSSGPSSFGSLLGLSAPGASNFAPVALPPLKAQGKETTTSLAAAASAKPDEDADDGMGVSALLAFLNQRGKAGAAKRTGAALESQMLSLLEQKLRQLKGGGVEDDDDL